MVRNITKNDFTETGDSLVLLAGQSALIVIDKDLQKQGRDPVVCSVIGSDDEIQVLYRLHKMDPGDLDIRYMTSETDPNVLVGVYDMMDFTSAMIKKLEDVYEYDVHHAEGTTLEDQLKYMYDCVHLEGMTNHQLTIYNHAPKEYREGYFAPADLFALFYGAIYPIGTYEEFLRVYYEEKTIVSFSGDMLLDDDKVTRVVVSLYPPEPGNELGYMLISLPGADTEEEAESYLAQFNGLHDASFS